MDLELQGKTALITGGSKGIGKAIAIALAEEGVDIAIAARSQDTLDAAAGEIRAATGRKVVTISADTTSWDDVKRMVETTVSELGSVDILVNSAAMVGGQVQGTIDEADEKDLIEDLDTKVVGYFRSIKAVVPHMRAKKWGRVISIGGVSARQSTIYGLRNAAVVHMTKTLSDQLGQDGITLNVVHPGLTLTDTINERLDNQAAQQGRVTRRGKRPGGAKCRHTQGGSARRTRVAHCISRVSQGGVRHRRGNSSGRRSRRRRTPVDKHHINEKRRTITMPMNKIDQTFEIEQEQLDWLGEVAENYGLADEAKALRVLLDFAIQDGDGDLIFSQENMRCRFCG